MLKQANGGVLINMSSESGLEGSEGQSVYAATKAANQNVTRSWAKELGTKGVRVIGVAPGIMETTGMMEDMETWEIGEWHRKMQYKYRNSHTQFPINQPPKYMYLTLRHTLPGDSS